MRIAKFDSDLPCGLRRFLALGAHKAACVAEIQARGLPAALEYADTMGGVGGARVSMAKSILRAVKKAGTVSAKRLTPYDGARRREVVLEILDLTWKFSGKAKRAVIEWVPVRAFPAPRA